MECVVTPQSTKGQVFTPGAQQQAEQITNQTESQKPTEETEQPRQFNDTFQITTYKIRDEISCYNARFAKKVLTAMVDEVSEITDRADKLLSMEKDIRTIYNKLDDKTKCMIAILDELDSVEGKSVGVDFGNQILHEELSSRENAEKYIGKSANDPDITTLAYVYELAKFINDNEVGTGASRVLSEPSKAQGLKTIESQTKQETSKELSTGLAFLDELISGSACDTIAAMYAIATLLGNTDTLGNDVYSLIQDKVKQSRKGEFPHDADAECEIMPAMKWIAFTDGVRVGSND